MPGESPLERARSDIVGIVSMLVTGIFLAALFTGQSWWLPFMLVGYIVVVPITAILFGDEDDIKEWVEDEDRSASDRKTESDRQDALETLRDRYARGELTDEQFERKVEQLLETETLEDIEDRHSTESTVGAAGRRDRRERERERT